jgi:phage terminase small subunit
MPGRTGRRRYTAAEARLIGAKAVYEHRRLYGDAALALSPLPDPPDWFTPALAEIWHHTLAAAAPGSLAALDYDNLVAYCVAAMTYRRLAQRLTGEDDPTVGLERRVRAAAIELGRASKALGILPYDRSKIPVTPTVEPDEFAQFDTILPDGRRAALSP